MPPLKKNPSALWALSIVVHPEAEDAAAELLWRTTGQAAVVTHSRISGLSTATTYLDQPRFWTVERRRRLRQDVADLAALGLNVGPARLSWNKVPKTDWRESWKRHFQPISVGRILLVRPSWSARRAVRGQASVVLDPGLSFGTGQHPTTAFCLREVARHRPRNGRPAALLDVGTGSGILAIAAAKLGYTPVEAFDFDPESVRIARENALRNRVEHAIRLHRKDVARLRQTTQGRYAVVCANLTADLLVAHGQGLLSQVAPDGHLVLAGILDEEFEAVACHFEKLGTRRVAERRSGEWRSGSFLRLEPAGLPKKRR